MVGGVPIAVDSVVNIAVGLTIIVAMTLFLAAYLDRAWPQGGKPEPNGGAADGDFDHATSAIAWGLGGLVGAVAGVLVAPSLFLDTNFMGALLIKAFAGGVLGGLNSLIGVFLGASRSASPKSGRRLCLASLSPMRSPSSSL